MATERRVITTPDTVWQHIFPPKITTTNATPTAIYVSNAAIQEGRALFLRSFTLVYAADLSKLGSFYTEATVGRATGGNIRIVSTNYQRVAGDYQPNKVSLAWTVNTGTQTFALTATGSTGTTATWNTEIDLLRNV
jgi:hypothetical protein